KLVIDGVTLDKHRVSIANINPKEKPIDVILVFHNHQPPNYGPDSIYRAIWPFNYVWRPILFPYGLGPYHYHAVLLKKLGIGVKLVYNLSPSLIKQWIDIVEKGIKILTGEVIEPTSDLTKNVKEAINMYRELVHDEIIEVVTSIYAHTIAGYLVDTFNIDDILKRELEYGFNITKSFTSKDPKGIWLPEMSFSMKLIPIIRSVGLEYTFLDEKYHLRAAEGDVKNHYEPYIVGDNPSNGLVVFFRDTELSNDISFANNYCSDIHAIKGAYNFIYKLLNKCAEENAKVLTIALDGENWMIFSKNPPATAIFLETILLLFKKLGRINIAKLTTAKEALKSIQPVRKLKYIPSTTWLGSYTKWRGEVLEQEKYWKMVEQIILKFKEYTVKYGFDERAKKAEWALWHILDSDYWWAEFWNEEMILLWIKEFDKYIK
ncbi:MAG: glycoside hydrolase, partial [Ignisphaera sp.]